MKRIKIEIEGMTCPNCEKHAEKELKAIGATDIKVSHKEKSAILTASDNVNEELLKRAIKTAGYVPGKIFFKKVEKRGFFGKLLR